MFYVWSVLKLDIGLILATACALLTVRLHIFALLRQKFGLMCRLCQDSIFWIDDCDYDTRFCIDMYDYDFICLE